MDSTTPTAAMVMDNDVPPALKKGRGSPVVGSTPTTTSYTCRPYKTGNAETCTLTPTSNTTYYIRVYAYSAFSGVTLTYGTN